ncbi:uncharacterized protein LOC129218929 [Uloborus diversus]|uniref:uncharacterized protein LOC129218929 n=1 Tax=Uloborus diversus TaxID=327109 RepID=UPI0024097290|nr:uncharacterized protein LOC129218929 [Uloborus diversus]
MLDDCTPLHVFKRGSVTAARYTDVVVEPYAHLLRGAASPELILIDVNTRAHRAPLGGEFPEGDYIHWMDYPSRSLDSNPIEHIWDVLGRAIATHNTPPIAFIKMLESKKELVVLEANLSSASTKRSPFHLLSSIFSKKKQSILDNDSFDKPTKHNETESAPDLLDKQSSRVDDGSIPPGAISDPNVRNDALFLSPAVNVRKKNLKIDLETLHLSRQDNPYLKQLERFSLPEETLLSCSDFHSLAEKALLQSEWQLDSEKDVDIHQHLVRSPPPQFPQNITHFMYSQANSPKRQINQTDNENEENADCEGNKRSKPLNPVQQKRELGVLDPGIREVLEYQKSQLIAGIQHSLNIGQAKFGTAPAHYVPVQGSLSSPNSQARWTNDSGSRLKNGNQGTVPNTTSSLPGLISCYLDLEQASRKTPLGPIRIGRTLSDSICHDNKIWNTGAKQ